MVKELIIAIILGSTLGFILTGTFLKLSNNKTISGQSPIPTQTTQLSPTPVTTSDAQIVATPTPSVNLTISTPTDESISDTAKITVKGTTMPNNLVLVKTSIDTYTDTADGTGAFSIPVELDTGSNLVQVLSFDKDDNQTEVDINVTFSTAKI